MTKYLLIVAAAVLCAGCATSADVFRAQRDIVANDNRIAENISDQHMRLDAGDLEGLRASVESLQEANRTINERAEQIASDAFDTRELASNLMSGVQAYLGTLGGPVGGIVGSVLDQISKDMQDHDERLIDVREATIANTSTSASNSRDIERVSDDVGQLQSRIEQLSPELQEALMRIGNVDAAVARLSDSSLTESEVSAQLDALLTNRGLTRAQISELRDNFSINEILAILASLGVGASAGAGGGAVASKIGKSRSADVVKDLQGRVDTIESNAMTLK